MSKSFNFSFIKLLTIISLIFTIGYTLYSPQQAFAQTASSGKTVQINLTQQRLTAYQGNTVIYSMPISSGTLIHPTPIGTFYPYWKTPSIEMKGGSKTAGDYYDLPNVPWDVFIYGGVAIHGAYWHNNFGFPMSHGCINLSVANARLIYNWIDYSTPITISGVTPG
jgi:lipoprotein-anchoring transpeptidase ErfK/SrfK